MWLSSEQTFSVMWFGAWSTFKLGYAEDTGTIEVTSIVLCCTMLMNIKIRWTGHLQLCRCQVIAPLPPSNCSAGNCQPESAHMVANKRVSRTPSKCPWKPLKSTLAAIWEDVSLDRPVGAGALPGMHLLPKRDTQLRQEESAFSEEKASQSPPQQ